MAKWRFTTIQHPVRIAMGLSPNEYCVLDMLYQSQTHPDYTVGGWAKESYRKIGAALGISEGTVHAMAVRFVKCELMEVDETNPKLKRTLPAWYNHAYLSDPDENTIQFIEENIKRSKIERSKIERKRSKIEQHINGNSKDSLSIKEDPQNEIKPNVAKTLNESTDEILSLILANYAATQQLKETAKTYNLKKTTDIKNILREVVRDYQSNNINYILNEPHKYLSKILARLDRFAQVAQKSKSSTNTNGRNKNALAATYTPIEKL